MQDDYYSILGVSRTASQDEIKRAYRILARKYHPDCNPNNVEAATKRFQKLRKAFETLGDPQKRREYDRLFENARSTRTNDSDAETKRRNRTENSERARAESGGADYRRSSSHNDEPRGSGSEKFRKYKRDASRIFNRDKDFFFGFCGEAIFVGLVLLTMIYNFVDSATYMVVDSATSKTASDVSVEKSRRDLSSNVDKTFVEPFAPPEAERRSRGDLEAALAEARALAESERKKRVEAEAALAEARALAESERKKRVEAEAALAKANEKIKERSERKPAAVDADAQAESKLQAKKEEVAVVPNGIAPQAPTQVRPSAVRSSAVRPTTNGEAN